MKLTKIISASAALLMAFSVAGCKLEEDALNMLQVSGDNCTINYTNDGSVAEYARAFLTTKTAHLSADMAIEIDTNKTTTGSGYATTTGYIFNVSGSGTEAKPYSFCLIGIRKNGNTPEYFASYYIGVLSADCTSSATDFDTKTNKAYEYDLSGGWKSIPAGSYTESNGKLSVYIAVTAMNGSTEITSENWDKTAGNGANPAETNADNADALKVTLKASESANTGTVITYNKDNINKGIDTKKDGAKEIGSFPVSKQGKLGFYAMVKNDSTLVANWKSSNFVAASEVIEE